MSSHQMTRINMLNTLNLLSVKFTQFSSQLQKLWMCTNFNRMNLFTVKYHAGLCWWNVQCFTYCHNTAILRSLQQERHRISTSLYTLTNNWTPTAYSTDSL